MAIREKLDETIEENRILRERVEKNESLMLDCEREIKKLQEQNNALMEEVTTAKKAQKARESECQKLAQEIEKLSKEIEKLSKENIEYKKKCDGFFQQVVSMNSKQKESEDEFSRIKRAFDHQAAELEEKRALNNLMSDSVSIMTNK